MTNTLACGDRDLISLSDVATLEPTLWTATVN